LPGESSKQLRKTMSCIVKEQFGVEKKQGTFNSEVVWVTMTMLFWIFELHGRSNEMEEMQDGRK